MIEEGKEHAEYLIVNCLLKPLETEKEHIVSQSQVVGVSTNHNVASPWRSALVVLCLPALIVNKYLMAIQPGNIYFYLLDIQGHIRMKVRVL